jgi:CRP-like cAMP-binding protein
VFLQWRAESSTLSCLCAEAMGEAKVISVSQSDLTSLIAAQPAAAIDVISSFAKRVTESQVLIEDLLNNSVNVRLYRTLLDLAREFGRAEKDGTTLIDVSLTHQRLADMIGSNRVTVTRKLHELTERGIVLNRRNATIAVRVDQLTKLALSDAG